jgi:hypothetical protein
MDDVRNGEPVIATTFSAIFTEPGEFEGKWVRVSGWIDKGAALITSEKGDDNDWFTLHLDPQRKLRSDPEFEGGIPERAAVVSGQLDLTCARFFSEGYRALHEQGLSISFGAAEPGPLAHCNRARGPNLIHVLVSSPAGAQQ